MTWRRVCSASAVIVFAAVAGMAKGQAFYQLTNPRIYRVDPPTNNPWYHGYGITGVATVPVEGDANGNLLITWECPPTDRGDLAELRIDFGVLPNAQAQNDATLLGQTLDWGWCYNLDYESDNRVLVHDRGDYPVGRKPAGAQMQTIASGVGRFVRQGGQIAGFELAHPYRSALLLQGGRIWGTFSGSRTIAGAAYDTVAIVQEAAFGSTIPVGIYLVDIVTGEPIDAAPGSPDGYQGINPYIGISGNTGVPNVPLPIVVGSTLIAGLEVVGDTAFLLIVVNWNLENQYLALAQLDFVGKRVMGIANVSDMLNPTRGGKSSHWTWGFDVWPIGDDKVRILITERTDLTLTSLAAIDGVLAPEGTDPVDPNALFVAEPGGGSPSQPNIPGSNDGDGNGDGGSAETDGAVFWVCPGIGIAFPGLAGLWGLWMCRRSACRVTATHGRGRR